MSSFKLPSWTGLGSGASGAGDEVRGQIVIGAATAILLIGCVGVWGATANLAGAVLASGTVVVENNVKKVQHATGGIVGEIRVKDGDKVAAGDLVLRLDDTLTKANLGIIVSQLKELGIRQARLKAERDGKESFDLPTSLAAHAKEAAIIEILAGEQSLFESRRKGREGQKAQLNERIQQLNEEISGLIAQTSAKAREIELVNRELSEIQKLWEKNLAPLSKYTALQREAARIQGEHSQLIAHTAQARAKIAETRLQILQVDQDMRTEVMRDLREAQAKDAELSERRIAAEDQLKRVDLNAPLSGIVHQLAVHTVGGVINAAEPVLLIVPESDALVVEAKVAPQDIDHVHPGQAAFIRFTAFNQRTTPEFKGAVTRISADLHKDPQTGQSYYVARISLTEGEAERMGKLKLLPGMPAEVYIKTTDRTPISFMMKPLVDQFTRAFTER